MRLLATFEARCGAAVKVAVIADVHANEPALEAVLAALAREAVDEIWCCGDLVGYHADPELCLDMLATKASCVLGNHDTAVLQGALTGANTQASRAVGWTRARLGEAHLAFLASLPKRRRTSWGSVVHGCLINPEHVTGYITSTTAPWNLERLAELEQAPHVAFFGHTHVPALHLPGQEETRPPLSGTHRLPGRGFALVNPGAVGQPRDGDPRAAYAVLETQEWTIRFERVAYDIEKTCRRLRQAGFDEGLCVRLREGR